MNKTLSFVRLDYITIKPYMTIKNLFLLLFLCIFIGYGTKEASMLIGILMMYSTLFSIYPFAVGDKNGIDALYATLPLKKSNIVMGRYIFTILINVMASIIAFAVSTIIMTVLEEEMNREMILETFLTILLCFIIFSTVEAVQMPIYFKLGYTKAKFLAYLPLICFPTCVVLIAQIIGKERLLPLADNIFSWVLSNKLYTAVIVIVIWVLIMMLSVLLSLRFYKKREI